MLWEVYDISNSPLELICLSHACHWYLTPPKILDQVIGLLNLWRVLTLDIWAHYKLVMQVMHENFLQTWWHYTLLPFGYYLNGQFTNCPSCLGQHSLLLLKHLFSCKRREQIRSDDCQVLWKQILINLLMKSEEKCFIVSIYLIVSWIVLFVKTQHTIPSNPSTHTSVTCSAHSEHAQWHVQYPNIISLFWIESIAETNKQCERNYFGLVNMPTVVG